METLDIEILVYPLQPRFDNVCQLWMSDAYSWYNRSIVSVRYYTTWLLCFECNKVYLCHRNKYPKDYLHIYLWNILNRNREVYNIILKLVVVTDTKILEIQQTPCVVKRYWWFKICKMYYQYSCCLLAGNKDVWVYSKMIFSRNPNTCTASSIALVSVA